MSAQREVIQEARKVLVTVNDKRAKDVILKMISILEESKDDELETTEEMLSVEEVAEIFGVTQQAVYKWIKNNKIKYNPKTPAGGYLIPKSQFNLLEDDHIEKAQKKLLGPNHDKIEVVNHDDVYEIYKEK